MTTLAALQIAAVSMSALLFLLAAFAAIHFWRPL
jgi:hypothetical protein